MIVTYSQMRITGLLIGVLASALSSVEAQQVDSTKTLSDPVIQDNSFLVEEAYNQDAGVVQHITTFQLQRRTNDFDASFTQEWPVGSIKHQLSYGIPFSRIDSQSGIGDVAVNYRYQLLGDGAAQLAISPRISVTLPTGDWRKSRGNGAAGFNAMVPFSYVVSPMIVTHFDIGGSLTPSARNASGDRARTAGWITAGSVILTASRRIQPLLEAVYSRGQEVIGRNRTAWGESALISPGLRGAFNFTSGLQIVPGIAYPIGVGASHGERSIFFYLSFEHPFNEKGRPSN